MPADLFFFLSNRNLSAQSKIEQVRGRIVFDCSLHIKRQMRERSSDAFGLARSSRVSCCVLTSSLSLHSDSLPSALLLSARSFAPSIFFIIKATIVFCVEVGECRVKECSSPPFMDSHCCCSIAMFIVCLSDCLLATASYHKYLLLLLWNEQ